MNFARTLSFSLVFNSILLMACQSIQPPSKSFDRHSAIKRIAILSIPEPEVFRVVQLPPSSLSALAIVGGPIVAMSVQANEEKKSEALTKSLTAAIKPLHPQIALIWARALQEQLKIKGFDAVLIDGGDSPTISKEYSGLPVDFDAVLESRLTSVGIASFDGIRFLPSVGAAVQLRGRNSKKLLFSESYRYGAGPGSLGTVYVPAGANDAMNDLDSILSNPQIAIDRMSTGATQIAVRVVQVL